MVKKVAYLTSVNASIHNDDRSNFSLSVRGKSPQDPGKVYGH